MKVLDKVKFEILIFFIFVFVRIPELGHDTFNTDVWKWKSRSYDFGTGVYTLNFAKTLQRYHPGVTLMWIGSTAVKLNNLLVETRDFTVTEQIFLLHFIQKIFVVILLGFCYSLIFNNLKKILSGRSAFLATILLLFEPFNMALTRELHLEGLLSHFMLLSILYMYRAIVVDTSINFKLFRLSALFAGLSILTKTTALFLLPFALIMFFYYLKSSFGKKLMVTINWGILVLIVCILFWPALWVIPVQVITSLYKGVFVVGADTDHIQFYFGKVVSDPGYLYYFVVLGLRSSIIWLAGLLIGLFAYKKLNWERVRFVGFLLFYSVLYLFFLTLASKKLDRYILPSLLSLSIISSTYIQYFLDTYLSKLKNNIKFILILLPTLFTFAYLKFDFLSYYNPIFGGLRVGMNVLEPKWMIGTKEIVQYFKNIQTSENYAFAGDDISFEKVISASSTDNVLSVGFQEKYYTQIWPFFREFGSFAIIQDLTPFAVRADYFVYPVWDDSGLQENRSKLEKIGTIKIRGVNVYNVYKRHE